MGIRYSHGMHCVVQQLHLASETSEVQPIVLGSEGTPFQYRCFKTLKSLFLLLSFHGYACFDWLPKVQKGKKLSAWEPCLKQLVFYLFPKLLLFFSLFQDLYSMYPDFDDSKHKLFVFRPNLALSDHSWKPPMVMKLATFWNPGNG